MNDIDTVLHEVLEGYARDVTPSPDLAARAARRSRQIRHRRIATASATTAAVLGVTGVAAASAVGNGRPGSNHTPGSVKLAAPTGTVGPRTTVAPLPDGQDSSADPSPSPGFGPTCPEGEAPMVRAAGAATDSGDQSNDTAQTLSQALMQSYLSAISNHVPISAYGVGTDSASGQGVVWIQFHDQSTVELVSNDSHSRWSSYDATLGPCVPIGS